MLEFLAHLDTELARLFVEYGAWIYSLLFAIAFLESTVTPFLPGDALIFAAGAAAASGAASLVLIWVLFVSATVLGTMTSYWLGETVGPRAFRENRRFLNAEQLAHVHILFNRFGANMLVVGRFVPVVRTFAPVVAGIVRMPRSRFVAYSTLGAVLWVTALSVAGYMVDTIPMLQSRFGLVLAAVFTLSLGPLLVEVAWERLGRPLFQRILPRFLGHAYEYVKESGRMVARHTLPGKHRRQASESPEGKE